MKFVELITMNEKAEGNRKKKCNLRKEDEMVEENKSESCASEWEA